MGVVHVCLVLSDCQASLSMGFSKKNTGMGCHSLLCHRCQGNGNDLGLKEALGENSELGV